MNDTRSNDDMLELVALYALGVLPRERPAHSSRHSLPTTTTTRRANIARCAPAPTRSRSARTNRSIPRGPARMKEPSARAVSAPMPQRVRRTWRGAASAPTPAGSSVPALPLLSALIFSVVTVVQDVPLRSDLAQANRRTATLTSQLADTERVGQHDRQMVTDLVAPDARRYEVAQGAVVVRADRVYFALVETAGASERQKSIRRGPCRKARPPSSRALDVRAQRRRHRCRRTARRCCQDRRGRRDRRTRRRQQNTDQPRRPLSARFPDRVSLIEPVTRATRDEAHAYAGRHPFENVFLQWLLEGGLGTNVPAGLALSRASDGSVRGLAYFRRSARPRSRWRRCAGRLRA